MFWTFEHLNFGFVSNFDILGFLIGFIILIRHFSIDMTPGYAASGGPAGGQTFEKV
jgi:hypothetical protein